MVRREDAKYIWDGTRNDQLNRNWLIWRIKLWIFDLLFSLLLLALDGGLNFVIPKEATIFVRWFDSEFKAHVKVKTKLSFDLSNRSRRCDFMKDDLPKIMEQKSQNFTMQKTKSKYIWCWKANKSESHVVRFNYGGFCHFKLMWFNLIGIERAKQFDQKRKAFVNTIFEQNRSVWRTKKIQHRFDLVIRRRIESKYAQNGPKIDLVEML